MKKLLITLLVITGGLKAFSQTPPTIEAKEAAKHVNEKVRICDKVYGGKYFANTGLTLLDIGGNHPNETLTLVVKADDRKKFKTAPEGMFKGKAVCVIGTIILYKGKPEIEITDADQLKEAM